ncbi:MAG: hypothetical protein CVU73_12045 [Deltaproteobacteria bacterium HGW-Deltaproteobacteria-8]|nr:MAG: hypothetical protein CVU73_12045 [Deltaproteobacteria bacterium HGW-Deltaproteobacteria-8]
MAQKPPYAIGGEPGFFTQGDPVQGLPATVPGQDFLNRIQEEICNVILASGRPLDGADDTQLVSSIMDIIAAHAPTIGPASTTEAGIVERATAEEVINGEDAARYVCPADLMAALVAGLAGVARVGAVNAYTRQQYAALVSRVGASGAQAVERRVRRGSAHRAHCWQAAADQRRVCHHSGGHVHGARGRGPGGLACTSRRFAACLRC